MKIGQPEIITAQGELTIRYPVELAGRQQVLWYSVEERNAHLVEPGYEAPLAGLLIPTLTAGEEIYLAGALDQKQEFYIQHQLLPLLKIMLPGIGGTKIHAPGGLDRTPAGLGIMSGFSAGVDSFITLQDFYLSPEVEEHSRLTHLAFFNVGSNGSGKGGDDLFSRRVAYLRQTANELRLPLVAVNSNLAEFYSDAQLNFEKTHTLRSASAALLLQGGIRRFLYSAGYSYPDIFIRPQALMAHADPMILPYASTGAMDLLSTGTEYKRLDKVRRLTEIPLSYTHLNVCLKGLHNCGKCRKCIRVQLMLDLLGKIDLYREVFNLEEYFARRRSFIYQLFYFDNPFVKEILSLAKTSPRAPFYMKVLMLLRGIKA